MNKPEKYLPEWLEYISRWPCKCDERHIKLPVYLGLGQCLKEYNRPCPPMTDFCHERNIDLQDFYHMAVRRRIAFNSV